MKNNIGIDFFPMSTDFFEDDKIALIEAEFGIKGSYTALRLLCKIYKFEGYFCQWGKDQCLIFAKQLGDGFKSSTVDEIVQGLIRRGFFDKAVFDSFQVLTSRGMQRRFFEACKRRQVVYVNPNYLLADITEFSNIRFGNAATRPQSQNETQGQETESGPVPVTLPETVQQPQPGPERPQVASRRVAKPITEEDTELEILENFFFERNFVAPQMQYKKLVNYNLTANRNWTTMPHAKRIAAAAMWNQRTSDDKPDDRKRFKPEFLSMWKKIYHLAKDDMKADVSLLRDLLDDRLAYRADLVRNPYGPEREEYDALLCPGSVEKFLQANKGKTLPILRELIHDKTLSLQILKNSNNG